jgi:hypothetical protein
MKKVAAIAQRGTGASAMTTHQAAYAAILAMDGPPPRRLDRIRARFAAARTHRSLKADDNSVHVMPALTRSENQEDRGLHLIADTRGTRPRGPHPGDVIYWVACLGGACLLLLCATS